MRHTIRALLFAMLSALLLATGADAQQKLNRGFPAAPGGFIRIFNLAGTVEVIGWDRDSVAVTGTAIKPPGGEVHVSRGAQGGKISVWGDDAVNTKPSHLVVHVPRNAQVWVKTHSASIAVREFGGGLDLFSVTGAITVADRPRELYAETMAGSVNLSVITRSARVKTAGGSVTVGGRVDDATISTVSGAIDIAARFSRARIESIDGSIRYAAQLLEPANIELMNHSGDTELFVSPTAQAQFSINTFEGDFDDELGVTAKQWSGKLKAKEISFTVGKEQLAEVFVRSFRGRVVVKKGG